MDASPRTLSNLILGEVFCPGTTFDFHGETWTRRYFVNNLVRGAESPTHLAIEQNPVKQSPYAALARPNHAPHEGCDGRSPHRIIWVIEKPRRYVAVVVDGVGRNLP